MKQITRGRQLTKEEAAKYDKIREQVEKDLPELIARHHRVTREERDRTESSGDGSSS